MKLIFYTVGLNEMEGLCAYLFSPGSVACLIYTAPLLTTFEHSSALYPPSQQLLEEPSEH